MGGRGEGEEIGDIATAANARSDTKWLAIQPLFRVV